MAKSLPLPLSCPQAAFIPQEPFGALPLVSLARPVSLIGSGGINHVRLRSRSVSRVHAVVLNTDGRLLIRDLASRTHVIINGQPARESVLREGDRIQIGKICFVFSAGREQSSMGVREPADLARLRVGGASDELPVASPVVLFGGRPGADLLVEGEGVAHAHALVLELGGRRFLRDLGSGKETRKNGALIRQVELHDGDVIGIGAAEIHYSESRDEITGAIDSVRVDLRAAEASQLLEEISDQNAGETPTQMQTPAGASEMNAAQKSQMSGTDGPPTAAPKEGPTTAEAIVLEAAEPDLPALPPHQEAQLVQKEGDEIGLEARLPEEPPPEIVQLAANGEDETESGPQLPTGEHVLLAGRVGSGQPADPAVAVERFRALGPLAFAVASNPGVRLELAAEDAPAVRRRRVMPWLLLGAAILAGAAVVIWFWWRGQLF